MERRLIELVRPSPALWDVKSPLFIKKSLKKKLYNRIVADLRAAFPNRDGLTIGMLIVFMLTHTVTDTSGESVLVKKEAKDAHRPSLVSYIVINIHNHVR